MDPSCIADGLLQVPNRPTRNTGTSSLALPVESNDLLRMPGHKRGMRPLHMPTSKRPRLDHGKQVRFAVPEATDSPSPVSRLDKAFQTGDRQPRYDNIRRSNRNRRPALKLRDNLVQLSLNKAKAFLTELGLDEQYDPAYSQVSLRFLPNLHA